MSQFPAAWEGLTYQRRLVDPTQEFLGCGALEAGNSTGFSEIHPVPFDDFFAVIIDFGSFIIFNV